MNGGIKWILIDPYIPANSFGIISIKNQSRLFYYKQNNFNFETKTVHGLCMAPYKYTITRLIGRIQKPKKKNKDFEAI